MTDSQDRYDPSDDALPDPQNAGRRKVVKTMVGGVGTLLAYHVLPTTWSKPIIEQVYLPAHAAGSGVALADPCSIAVVAGDVNATTVIIQVSGFVTPPIGGLTTRITATPSGAGTTTTVSTATATNGSFSSQIAFSGAPGITSVSVLTTVTGASGSAHCSVMLPAGTTMPPSPSTSAPN